MPTPTFTVFQDQDASSATIGAPSSKSDHAHDTPSAATKENINPLTGLAFDSQPPLKKRKPSSSSALKVKPLPSSSKPSSKSKRLSSTSAGKDKGKRKAVLGMSGLRNTANFVNELETSEGEQLRTALGNRNAYNFTVRPLADVTQAYDESEAASAVARAGRCAVEDEENTPIGLILQTLTEENDVEMCDITSKETQTSVHATAA